MCSFCGKIYESRNVLFRHLRDVGNSCGQDVHQQGGIEGPPSAAKARMKREEQARRLRERSARKRREKRKTRLARDEEPDDCSRSLWVGDLPLKWSFTKRLQLVLFVLGPPGAHPTGVISVL